MNQINKEKKQTTSENNKVNKTLRSLKGLQKKEIDKEVSQSMQTICGPIRGNIFLMKGVSFLGFKKTFKEFNEMIESIPPNSVNDIAYYAEMQHFFSQRGIIMSDVIHMYEMEKEKAEKVKIGNFEIPKQGMTGSLIGNTQQRNTFHVVGETIILDETGESFEL